MPETLASRLDDNSPTTPDSTPEATALEHARDFLLHEIPALQKLTGLAVDVRIGKGWETDPTTGSFTVDPKFFFERGYSAEHSIYATLHELLAHVRGAKHDPVAMARRIAFGKQGEAQHLFDNILTDVEGNKLMHRMLPAQTAVGEDIYANRQFPLERDGQTIDYAAKPLHIQFLYKMIRQEMIPDSETPVRPETDDALASLRNYKGTGQDVIALLTRPGIKRGELGLSDDAAHKPLSDSERFDLQLAIIYPVYQALLEQAKQEAAQQQANSNEESGDGDTTQADQQSGASEPANDQSTSPSDKDNSGQPSDPFAADYADYHNNVHPEPISEEQAKNLDDMIRQSIREQQDASRPPDTRQKLDAQLRRETGFGVRDHELYAAEVEKHRDAIAALRDVYKSIIQERVAQRRGLSRRAYAEGDILDPNKLAQLIIDKKAGIHEPEAFTRYEHVRGQTELVGNTDYIFVFDRSSSMAGNGKSAAAATSALIMLEALAAMERDVKEAEERTGIELDLDIRTALYTFNSAADCLKQLSPGLSDTERLQVQQAIRHVKGLTADYLALQDIAALPRDTTRKRIITVVSDGESDDEFTASKTIRQLRANGDMVFGIGIGSDAATRLYAPDSQRVDNPADLPEVLQSFIESTLR